MEIINYLYNFINYLYKFIKTQIKTTEKIVFYILFIELLIIISYMYYPKFKYFFIYNNGLMLLDKPIYLNKKRTLGSFEELYKDGKRIYNYSISSWFNINPQASTSSNSNILTYANKIFVKYNGSKNTLTVYAEKHDNIFIDVAIIKNLKLQYWNHIVINYDGGIVDIFLNGKLVGSSPEITPYMNFEPIIIGDNNSLQGGIQKTFFYNKIRTSKMIYLEYFVTKLFL